MGLMALLVVLPAMQEDVMAGESSRSGNATVCNTDEARESAENWDYDPVDAYEFGQKIQQYVEGEDLQSLFGLVQGELSNGPRKKAVKGKLFSEVFSKTWRENVLSKKPNCSPLGWRGFEMGNGNIWYQQDYKSGDWKIFSINGAREFEASKNPLDGRWKYNGELLSSNCFTKIWYSGDNYEYYYDTYIDKRDIDLGEFSMNIGRYIGGSVPVAPIPFPWSTAISADELSLSTRLSECLQNKKPTKTTMDGSWVSTKICQKDKPDWCLVNKYQLIMRISLNNCRFLAPYYSNNCIDLGLVQISEESGGSMGNMIDVGIYGIVIDQSANEIYVIPLVNFSSLNEALNYVDELDK